MNPSRNALIPLFVLLFAAGCGREGSVVSPEGSAPPPDSPEAVQSEVAAMPDEFDVLAYDDGEEAKPDMAEATSDGSIGTNGALGPNATLAPIEPVNFFRWIRSHERHFRVEFERPDTNTILAHVLVVDRLLGSFNVVTVDETGGTAVRKIISKPLADTGRRKAVFARRRILEADDASRAEDLADGRFDGWSRWHLVGLSGSEIVSDDGTREIRSVRLVSGPIDVTITDPLEIQRFPRGLPQFPPDVPVLVTVVTGAEDDVVVLYTRWGRMLLRRNDQGEHVGRFRTPIREGLRHIAVNAIAHSTLFDDEARYDSKAWGIPFLVRTPTVADTAP